MSAAALLVGAEDLSPWCTPRGRDGSGHRLCLILGMAPATYLRRFERLNLCAGGRSWVMASHVASRIADEYAGKNCPVILLGSKVRAAFGVDAPPFSVLNRRGVWYAVLPHPSGRCRVWQDPDSYMKARAAVDAVIRTTTRVPRHAMEVLR